jgi:ribosomal protein L24E
MAYKSLIVSMEITTAGRAHNCRYNKNHRIERGVGRLTVKCDGDEHHYCLGCGKAFLVKDLERLRVYLGQVEAALFSK